MFSNPIIPDVTVDEGTVIQVDVLRCVCKVKTLTGKYLDSVQWLLPSGGSTKGADRFSPLVGDRVMINFGLGYPVIIGFFPRLQSELGSLPLKINTGETLVDTGSNIPDGSAGGFDQNKPKDMIIGDRIVSTISGNFLAILRGGAILLRSNRGAEIFLSKLYNLVRIVSRNWEQFTDLSSDVIQNFKGRIYRYTGYAPTFPLAKVEDYKLHFYYGDTALAEKVKTLHNSSTENPVANTIIYKEQVTDNPTVLPRELMRRTLNLAGEEEVYIYNGTHFTRIASTAEELRFTWNNQNIITITEDSIHAVHKDGADFIMDADGIRATFSDGIINMEETKVTVHFDNADVILDSNQVLAKLNNTSATLTDSSATLLKGNGTAIVSDSETKIVNGSHSVSVTSSGVAIV